MKNQIGIVEHVADEQRRGWPLGTNHLYRTVPLLLKRIEELEQALNPFTVPAVSERNNPQPPPLVHVYLRNCQRAVEVLDPSNTERFKPETFFNIPAE